MIPSIFDKTNIPFLGKALDAYSLRHEVVSDNLANIGTPGYKSKRVRFEEMLGDSLGTKLIGLSRTNENHLLIGKTKDDISAQYIEQNTGDPRASGMNDVNLDHEMAELAKNQIRFKFSSQMIANIFKGLNKSIKGEV
ncbi:MAG: flagellar basal body rod protein FlgB [Ignavibacteriales bacterium]|nr:flagellar basal body rod protein FlgB [Ignavibacteriales bacterium]